jgi:hypothetical protein
MFFISLVNTSNLFLLQGHVKKDPFFFMAWKFFSNASMYILSIMLDYAHDHLDGREWYFGPF